MFSRRYLRVKLMHSFYAYKQESISDVVAAEKYLFDSLDSTYHLYLQLNYILREVIGYSNVELEVAKKKILPSDEIKSTDAWNDFDYIVGVNEFDFDKTFKKLKIDHKIEPDLIKDLYKSFKNDKEYGEIIKKGFEEKRDQVYAIQYVLADIIMNNEQLDILMEEKWLNWQDDKEYVLNALLKTIKSSDASIGKSIFAQEYEGWSEDAKFLKEMIKVAFYDADEIEQLIELHTKNWVLDRITLIDRVIIHLGITEMKTFTNIPLKVSLNEYIELAKMYSTPKSKDFVNGVLDRTLHKLIDEGEREK